METINLSTLPPLSLYIHIPWCTKKCPYCDFNSHVTKTIPETEYIDALTRDLEQALPLIWGRSIHTIFIGGGTPSLFSGAGIERILTTVRSLTNLSPFAEITMEANPGALDTKYLKQYREAGVNRLSLGVQSFNDTQLKNLGRIHDSKDVIDAINSAKKYFENINLDLIYGLPKQSLADLEQEITTATSFEIPHISYYNLTIEENTFFHASPPKNLPDNDMCYLMGEKIKHDLAKAGYNKYEVSAYSKPERQAQHNLNYWNFGDYLGIGAGSHSKISFNNKIIRQIRQKHPKTYMETVALNQHIIENKSVAPDDLPFEFALNAFRLVDGFDTTLFTSRCGISLSKILPKLLTAQTNGFIQIIGDKIIPTSKGQDFLNDLLTLFLKD